VCVGTVLVLVLVLALVLVLVLVLALALALALLVLLLLLLLLLLLVKAKTGARRTSYRNFFWTICLVLLKGVHRVFYRSEKEFWCKVVPPFFVFG
jgi:ABC-type transport system involved in cytochrome bd biosynthesis fused ATPase/permease subunit